MTALVIAPHPDDEVLGTGGTMARLSDEGHVVHVLIVTRGDEELFDEAFIERGRREAVEAHRVLGVADSIFLDGYPAAKLDTVPHHRLNAALDEVIRRLSPELLFLPFPGDLHRDHRLVFESAMVAARPLRITSLREILAYETLSETNWNSSLAAPSFVPNVFYDISDTLHRKVQAMERFQSQLQPAPHERSIESLTSLAALRGSTIGVRAAEAFALVRGLR